ncbi:RNA polymerase sigma factor SigJ [Nocardia altamirensis]|uniref:RNA polymerase sigma factor SigJ n=1 Tax=Nocardia altamirensis TaxID=472158 RepID=UPI0008405B0C|nr:RNA polymerase sigma factor SigJ [Nocardia altamirensis]
MAEDPFELDRAALFGVAYRMLGTRSDAEDVLQEAWLRWHRVDRSTVENARAYVFRLVANESIDHLRRARARREDYVGPWLPEPLVGDLAEAVALRESASVGLLLLLETLTPDERAVFVLHEAFDFAHAEIAELLGRSERGVRQLAYRARQRVKARRPRQEPDNGDHRELVAGFMAAAVHGDIEVLVKLLAPDAEFRADADGQRETPRAPMYGAVAIAEWFRIAAPFWPAALRVDVTSVNGGPGALVTGGGVPFLVAAFEVDSAGHVVALYAVLNSAKLAAVSAP